MAIDGQDVPLTFLKGVRPSPDVTLEETSRYKAGAEIDTWIPFLNVPDSV